MFKRLPSPAMVVACLALFAAMGGTGYAATHLSNGPNWSTAASTALLSNSGAGRQRGDRIAICPAGTKPISGGIEGFTTAAIGRSTVVGQSWEFSVRRVATIPNSNTITPSVWCLSS